MWANVIAQTHALYPRFAQYPKNRIHSVDINSKFVFDTKPHRQLTSLAEPVYFRPALPSLQYALIVQWMLDMSYTTGVSLGSSQLLCSSPLLGRFDARAPLRV